MKRIFCLLLVGLLLGSLTACQTDTDHLENSENNVDNMLTSCTKDHVDEFMSILGEAELGGLYGGMRLDGEKCYNVTPLSVAKQMDIKIFKFSDSCLTLALINGEIYSICEFFGGYGFVNAVPWDYDEDGKLDLLIASSWGSGLHRSIISVFNTTTKESIVVHDTSTTDDPSVDLFVAAVSPSFSSKDEQDLPIYYQVYSANVVARDNNLADLSYTATGVVGAVAIEDGMPVFKPYGS